MNQAEVGKLISQLRFKVQPKPWNIPSKESFNRGTRGQLLATRKSVTALIKDERVEFTYGRGVVVREYTERLLQEAISNGDKHVPTMDLATWWLTDKSLVHKLFKVLVPRFQDMSCSYTRMLKAPMQYSPGRLSTRDRVILELRGNPFPALNYSNTEPNRGLIHNVLLAEARREARLKSEYNLNLKKPAPE
uniref:Large ribosomal subunit protein bL17m n=1 Tax=Tortanus dextrilobatus TaxID=207953 RepID=A0A0U2MAJ0_9MAXI|nr:mitochondrial 39S ribosomal protein L17 [Tortanus dextrilobatus]